MGIYYFFKDSQYILNHSTKYLARTNTDPRHNYDGDQPVLPRDSVCEAWHFPVIDSYGGGAPALTDPAHYSEYNEITFVYAASLDHLPASVGVIGSFNNLYEALPLSPVLFAGEPTRYFSLTFVAPKDRVYLYKFLVDGQYVVDPINPHQVTLENGAVWSRFFTEECTQPLVFEPWEMEILYRLIQQILPFRTPDAETFLQQFYYYLDTAQKTDRYTNIYRLDESVGEVNFIDNMLARAERHRLVDYKICLRLIDEALRASNPYMEPAAMSPVEYAKLYEGMAANNVPGWDLGAYGSPQFFLDLLRRHAATGAFCHPKYGGNTAGAGWNFLRDRYQGQGGFEWGRAIEQPLGYNDDYFG